MNDLEKYHDQVVGQEVYAIQAPPEHETDAAPSIMAGVIRRWYIVLIIFLLFTGAGLPAVWFFVKPQYVVTGAIRVAPMLVEIISGERDPGTISNYESYMNTQAAMVTSSQVVQRVADDLKSRNLSFFQNAATDPVSKIKQKLLGTKINREPAWLLKQAFIDEVIVVTAPRNKELIEITMSSGNNVEAKQIVDAFIRAYMDVGVASAIKEEDTTLTTLEDALKLNSEKMESQRQTIYRLGQEYGTTLLDSRQDMMLQRVQGLLQTLTDVEANRINLEAQVQLLEQTKEQPIAPEDLLSISQEYINNDPGVVGLTENITTLEQELIVAQQMYTETNPEVQRKKELLEMMRTRLKERKEEANKAFDELAAKQAASAGQKKLVSLRSELEQAKLYEQRLRDSLSSQDAETIEIGRKQLTIQKLQEENELTKQMYNTLLERIQDLEMQRKRPTRISVAYNADITKVNDRRLKLSAALVFAGLVCGVGLAHLRDKADQSLRTPDDVARRIGIRIIGTTTSLNTIKPSLLPEQIIGDYQTIRANLGLLADEGIPRKLVVTSPGMREGKTTLAVNLATSLSESGKHVLLIDGDLRKPDVARLLNLPRGSSGLQDVLKGAEFGDVVHSIPSTGLDVLASDFNSAADVYEMLTLPSTAKLIKKISEKYDHVIIDTPPALGFPDAMFWAKLGDAVILTSYAGHTTMPDLREAKERLSQIGARILGTVLSSVQAGHSYYRHSHSYYAQSAQYRESAKLSRKKLMFSTDGNESIDGNSEKSNGSESNQNYSYTQSTKSRKTTKRARKKKNSAEDGDDNTDNSKA